MHRIYLAGGRPKSRPQGDDGRGAIGDDAHIRQPLARSAPMFADNRRPFLSSIPLGGSSLGAFERPEKFWDAWAFAAMEAELALAEWKRAARELKAAAFAAYRSALDREEQAAARLATRIAPSVRLSE
jgi:hypothetical protein